MCIEIDTCKPQQLSSLGQCVLLVFSYRALTSAAMASSSAAMDVDAAVPPLHQDLVQYNFVHMRLEVDWLEYYKVQIDVNFSHQLRIDNGTWHGSADYYFDTHGRDCWNLSFHPEGDTSRRMEHATFRQVLNTYTFLSIESTISNRFNSMIILKEECWPGGIAPKRSSARGLK